MMMRDVHRRQLAALACAIVAVVAPARSDARRKAARRAPALGVALGAIRGPGAAMLRRGLARQLRRVRGMRLTSAANAALTVRARITRPHRRRWIVRLTVLNTGQRLGTLRWRARQRRALFRPRQQRKVRLLLRRAARRLRRRLQTVADAAPAVDPARTSPAAGPPPAPARLDGEPPPRASRVAAESAPTEQAPPPAPSWAPTATTLDEGEPSPLAGEVEVGVEQRMSVRRPPLRASIGMRLFTRRLSFKDDLFGALRPYELPAAPAICADAEWYPLAYFDLPWLSHVGLSGSFEYAVGVSSEAAEGEPLSTRAMSASIGLKGLVPLGQHRLGLTLGYHYSAFEVEPSGEAAQAVGAANVAYHTLRSGVEGRIALPGNLALAPRAALLLIAKMGQMGAYFPRASGAGIEAEGAIIYGLTSWLELRLAFRMQRYFLSLNPEPGDPHVAGGAVDQYLSGYAGGTFRY